MFKHILFPTDGSANADIAAQSPTGSATLRMLALGQIPVLVFR